MPTPCSPYTASFVPKLETNAFGAPVHVASAEEGKLKRGEVYGVIAHPFAQLAEVLRAPREWCAIALLHLNIKTCTYERADGKGSGSISTAGASSTSRRKKPMRCATSFMSNPRAPITWR